MNNKVNRFLLYANPLLLAKLMMKKSHETATEFLNYITKDVGTKQFNVTITRGTTVIPATKFTYLREGDVLTFSATPYPEFFKYTDLVYTENAISPNFDSGIHISDDLSTYHFDVTKELAEYYNQHEGLAWRANSELDPECDTGGTNIMVFAPVEGGTVRCAWYPYSDFISSSETKEAYTIPDSAFKNVTAGEIWNDGKIEKVAKLSEFTPITIEHFAPVSPENYVLSFKILNNIELFYPYIAIKFGSENPWFIKLSPGKSLSELQEHQFVITHGEIKNTVSFKVTASEYRQVLDSEPGYIYLVSKTAATSKGLAKFEEYMFATKTQWNTPQYVFLDWQKSKAVNIKGTVMQEQDFSEVYMLCEYSEDKEPDFKGIYNATIIDDLGIDVEPSVFDLFYGGWIIAPQFLKHSNTLLSTVSVSYPVREDGTSSDIHDIVIGNQPIDLNELEFYDFDRNDDVKFYADEYYQIYQGTSIPTGRTLEYASVDFYDLINPQYDEEMRPIPFYNWKLKNYNVAEGDDESFRDISLRSIKSQLDSKDIINMDFKRDDTKTDDAYDNLRFSNRIPIAHWSQLGFIPEDQTETQFFAFYKGGQTCNISYDLNENYSPEHHEEKQVSVTSVVQPSKIGSKDIYSPYETVYDKYDRFQNISAYPTPQNPYQVTFTNEKIAELKNRGRTYKMFYDLKTNSSTKNNGILISASSKFAHYGDTLKAFKYDITFAANTGSGFQEVKFQDKSTIAESKISVGEYVNNTISYDRDLFVDESRGGEGVAETRMIIKLKEAFPDGVYLSPYAPVVRVKQVAEGHADERTIYWYEFTKQADEEGYEGGVYYCPINYKTTGGSQWELTGTYFVSLEPSRDIENLIQCNIKVDPYLADKGSRAVILYCDKPDDWFDPAGQTHVPYEFQLDTTTESKHNTGFVIRAYDDFSILVNLPACPAATMAERKGAVLCYSSTGLWNDAREVRDEQTGDIIELQPKISQAKWDDENNKVVVWGTLSLKDQKTLLNQIKTDSQDPSKKPTLYLNYYRV